MMDFAGERSGLLYCYETLSTRTCDGCLVQRQGNASTVDFHRRVCTFFTRGDDCRPDKARAHDPTTARSRSTRPTPSQSDKIRRLS